MYKRGIKVITRQCKASEVKGLEHGYDLIVTTTPLPKDLEVPVIQTLAFLTGIGKEDVLNQIQKALE
jgi:PTS system galactitol-specific IIB component